MATLTDGLHRRISLPTSLWAALRAMPQALCVHTIPGARRHCSHRVSSPSGKLCEFVPLRPPAFVVNATPFCSGRIVPLLPNNEKKWSPLRMTFSAGFHCSHRMSSPSGKLCEFVPLRHPASVVNATPFCSGRIVPLLPNNEKNGHPYG